MKKNHKISTFSFGDKLIYLFIDAFLIIVSLLALVADLFKIITGYQDTIILISVSAIGLLPVLFSAIKALINRKLTIDLLASIALIFSLINREWHSAVFIVLMLASARFFARFAENKARRAIKSLLKLRPEKVHLKINGKIIEVEIEKVKVGDLLIVEAGERVPVDGVVESGKASIDQSSLTGESEPTIKNPGDAILSSTLNISGSLVIRTTKIGEDTTFAKILKLVQESQETKAPITSITDNFTAYYIFLTLVASVLIYFFTENLILVLSILLVTCADDIAVAIPLAFTGSIITAAKKGIIIKGGRFVEGFAKIKTLVVDKTGTITEGRPIIQNWIVFNGYSEKELFSFLGAATSESNHPVAKAINKFVREKKIKIPEITEFYEEPGLGTRGVINKQIIFAGNINFLEENGIEFTTEEMSILEKEKSLCRSLVILGTNKKAIGFFSLADSLRPHVDRVIDELRSAGIERIIMLTGDNEIVANRIAKEAHISYFRANLLPEDKVAFLKKIITPKQKIAMIGDGVNDAAALAVADIGIAMGAIGSDAAIESADIALMKDDLRNITDLMKLSRYNLKVIYQNFVLWGIINVVGLILVFAGFLTPSGAAAYNFITDFLPILNSLKILWPNFKYE